MPQEAWALRLLGEGGPSLPQLLATDTVDSWDGEGECPVAGCPAVVTRLMGTALVAPDALSMPRLTCVELQSFTAQLLAALLTLQVHAHSAALHRMALQPGC